MIRRSFLAAVSAAALFPLSSFRGKRGIPGTRKEIGRLEIEGLRIGPDIIGDLSVVLYDNGFYKITRNKLSMTSQRDHEWDFGNCKVRVTEGENAPLIKIRGPSTDSQVIQFTFAQTMSVDVDGELIAEIG